MAHPSDRGESGDPLLGRIIGGNFRVLQLIGTGAMGYVYQAEQLSLGKMVALKLLRHELMGDDKLTKRFELEAKSASQLDHPNSIQIIDFGRDGDLLYIAMELLPGVDLGQLILREGPLPPARIGRIMDQVLAALDEAHAHGIVHRDLKPGNIMLVSRRGEPDYVKVCDFGIAKAQTSTEAAGLTMKGLVCGTPEYMSPEQARGEEVDGRSDLYAVGVILYQLVTGELPFTASSPVGILSKHLAEDPLRPSLRRPGLAVSPAFEEVILRALEKEPFDRPPTAQELRRLLRAALSDVKDWSAEAPLTPDRTRRLPSQPTTPITTPISLDQLSGSPSARPAPGSSGAPASTVMSAATMSMRWPRRTLFLISMVVTASAGGGWLWLERADRTAVPGAGTDQMLAEAGGRATAPTLDREPRAGAALPPTAPAPEAPPASEPTGEPPAPTEPTGEPPALTELAPPNPAHDPPPAAQPVRVRRVAKRVRLNRGSRAAIDEPSLPAPESRPLPAGGDPGSAGGSAPTGISAAPPAAPTAPAAPAGDPIKEAERLLAQGEVAAACRKLEEQKAMTPRLPAVHKLLGKCYMRSGQPDRAKENYRQYLELAPAAADAAFIKSIVK